MVSLKKPTYFHKKMRRKNLFPISLLFQHKHISLHRLGYLEVALHIIGSVDGVHRRFHGFCDFPEFPLHCLFVKLIQICHNSYFGAKIKYNFEFSNYWQYFFLYDSSLGGISLSSIMSSIWNVTSSILACQLP